MMIHGNPDGVYELAQLQLEQRRAEACRQRLLAQLPPRSTILSVRSVMSHARLALLAVSRSRCAT
jgi:hypothetical protein